MKAETRDVLSLFVRTAHELEGWRFIKSLQEQGGPFILFMHSAVDGSSVIEKVGPNDAETRAFLTTFRLFIQKKEPISLYKLDKLLSDPDLSDKCRQEFQKWHKAFLNYLGEPDRTLPSEDFPSRETILDIFINGRIFHLKQNDKRQIYEKWEQDSEQFARAVIAFNSILYTVYNVIVHIARVSEEELSA